MIVYIDGIYIKDRRDFLSRPVFYVEITLGWLILTPFLSGYWTKSSYSPEIVTGLSD